MSAKTDAYARALFEIARAEGQIDRVEDELYRVARAFESNDQLRATLSDTTIPAERREAVVEQLLGGRGAPTTVSLVSFVVTSGLVRDLPTIFDGLVALAAEGKSEDVAEVRSAVPLSDDQHRRLSAALQKATGRAVNLKVVVDPAVMGGLVAVVGDEVIDDTVRTRLEQLKTWM
jgi:F-type H+-transporting ATPase subunit delta